MNHERSIFLNMKEAEIIEEAKANFEKITGATVITKLFPSQKEPADGYLELDFEGRKQRFNMEVKNEIRSLQMQKIINQFQLTDLDWILIAQYIPPIVREQLKEDKINYLEASGNCFIKTANFYFFINDRKVTETRLPKEGKLWNATGLKFIFAILSDKALINTSYRQMAISSGIALGNVGPLLTELKNEGYLIAGKNGDLLANQELLRDKWVELYPMILRPKLRIGRFRKLDKNDHWEKAQHNDVLWGGEPAGAIMTKYLSPETFTIYTKESKSSIMKQHKLIPDVAGKVEAFQQFWSDDLQIKQQNPALVPPLITFAELATDKDSRNQETAERIKTNYLN
ncbi:type IV toxin-antitoxin system AbiEi family antitoxin [Mucilaginibacter sp. McL0603]|uniref:type IV toxin-antitoxin system AbiEi family antitoxin n=1 Tax=Mucilaginibacter sp. McL0603 TaxID=3415670 RepID=UPI003CE7549A